MSPGSKKAPASEVLNFTISSSYLLVRYFHAPYRLACPLLVQPKATTSSGINLLFRIISSVSSTSSFLRVVLLLRAFYSICWKTKIHSLNRVAKKGGRGGKPGAEKTTRSVVITEITNPTRYFFSRNSDVLHFFR